MGSTKRIGYSHERITMSNLFKALGHPARLSILELLLDDYRYNCNELTDQLPLSNSTISKHISIMFEQGILGSEVHLNNTFYTINPLVFESLNSFMEEKSERIKELDLNYRSVYFNKIST
jgi:DNA-binding transcriptional ArsR family regulator